MMQIASGMFSEVLVSYLPDGCVSVCLYAHVCVCAHMHMHVYVLTCVWGIMPHSCQKIPLCFLCLFQALAEEIKAMHGLQLNTKVPSEKS